LGIREKRGGSSRKKERSIFFGRPLCHRPQKGKETSKGQKEKKSRREKNRLKGEKKKKKKKRALRVPKKEKEAASSQGRKSILREKFSCLEVLSRLGGPKTGSEKRKGICLFPKGGERGTSAGLLRKSEGRKGKTLSWERFSICGKETVYMKV